MYLFLLWPPQITSFVSPYSCICVYFIFFHWVNVCTAFFLCKPPVRWRTRTANWMHFPCEPAVPLPVIRWIVGQHGKGIKFHYNHNTRFCATMKTKMFHVEILYLILWHYFLRMNIFTARFLFRVHFFAWLCFTFATYFIFFTLS